jgi:hypothetical protein
MGQGVKEKKADKIKQQVHGQQKKGFALNAAQLDFLLGIDFFVGKLFILGHGRIPDLTIYYNQ